jgi:5-methyltetrahydropteroyltriglutamate--homocysteine methyltransferase
MKRSTDRILTTHAGRLDGPPELRARTGAMMMAGSSSDIEAVRPLVRRGIADIIGKQTKAGIDIVSDGELG